MLIIGLDAASKFERFGWAVGHFREHAIGVTKAGVFGKSADSTLAYIASLLRTNERALISIDAPLGWPQPMGRFLRDHEAGEHLPLTKDEFFRRKTDESVRKRVGKNPLEVGADRIARAAHHALEVLGRLRTLSEREIPLAWTLQFPSVAAIEVYPAATLIAHDIHSSGYKAEQTGQEVRKRIAKVLRGVVKGIAGSHAIENEHAFDACLCLLAARDFLEGLSVGPSAEELDVARREGWIWLKECQVSRSASQRPAK